VTQEQRLLTIEDLARKTSWSWRPVLHGGTAQDLVVAAQSNPEGPAAQRLADEWLAARLNKIVYQACVEETDPRGFWYRKNRVGAARFVPWPWFIRPWYRRLSAWLQELVEAPRFFILLGWLTIIVVMWLVGVSINDSAYP
jgi:hypothetical protein